MIALSCHVTSHVPQLMDLRGDKCVELHLLISNKHRKLLTHPLLLSSHYIPPSLYLSLTHTTPYIHPSLPLPLSSNSESKSPTTYVQDYMSNVHECLTGLMKARPYHVRCLCSNDKQTPGHFDKEVVGQQIQHMAVFETVDLMQCGKHYIIMTSL